MGPGGVRAAGHWRQDRIQQAQASQGELCFLCDCSRRCTELMGVCADHVHTPRYRTYVHSTHGMLEMHACGCDCTFEFEKCPQVRGLEGHKIVQISAGGTHTLVLTSHGRWGRHMHT